MSWTENLIPASYRGVRFGVFGATKEFGKRVITHQFPLRDKPFHETMGLSPRAFTVDAFLIGDDVLARVKALEAAIETKGPGRLVHPFHGSIQVEALHATTAFASFEGRLARVSIAFEEAGTRPGPTGFLNTVVSLLGALSGGYATLIDAAASALRIEGEAAFLADAFATDIRAVASVATSAIGSAGLAAGLATIGAVVAPLSGRVVTPVAAFDALSALGSDGVGSGEEAVTLLSRAVRAVVSAGPTAIPLAGDPDPRAAVVDALVEISAAAPASAAAGATAPTRLLQAQNRTALSLLVSASAAMAAAEAATAVRWDNRDQLASYGTKIADAIDAAADHAGAIGLDDAWTMLGDVGAAWAQHVAAVSPPLPVVRTETPPVTVAASLLAYRLDGDALSDLFDRGGAIGRRNRARHPGFLPGGVALEVVGNG